LDFLQKYAHERNQGSLAIGLDAAGLVFAALDAMHGLIVLTRKMVRRGIFKSKEELVKKLMNFFSELIPETMSAT